MAQYRPKNHALHIYFRRHYHATSPQWRAKHPTHTPQDVPAPILIASFFAPHLQFNCKHIPKLYVACSSPANVIQNWISLAVHLQICFKIAWCLQLSCKYAAKPHFICSTYANMLQKHLSFAGLLQICYKKCILLAETPASMLQKCALFAELPANDAQNEKMLAAISANTTRHRAPPSAQQLALTSRRHT